MRLGIPALVVAALVAVGLAVPAMGGGAFFGIVLPTLAFALFAGGMAWKVLAWARVPVPFRIPTTCGQQASLPWIRQSRFDNPSTGWGAILRVLTETFLFRSLLRDLRSTLGTDGRLTYPPRWALWLGALGFHGAMAVIVLRHTRFFTEDVPTLVTWVQRLDGFVQVGTPTVYVTTAVFLAAVAFLALRRLVLSNLRYLSLPADWLPLFLLLGVGTTGALMRHVFRTDLVAVKDVMTGLASFHPVVPPDGLSGLFWSHLLLVCVLFASLPFTKGLHMAAMFLSPTHNLANNSRAVRHVNPWDRPLKYRTYVEYEDEFRDRMVAADIPVEKTTGSEEAGK